MMTKLKGALSASVAVAAIAVLSLSVSACGEMGDDAGGPIKAYLIVQRPDGTKADFYLGGYKNQADCAKLVNSEVSSYQSDQGGEFWTNPGFTYGGFKQAGWERNVILGSRCEHSETPPT